MTKACILIPMQILFVGCDRDIAVVKVANPSVVVTYETYFLNDGPDITAIDEVLSAPWQQKEEMERFTTMKYVDTCKVPDGYVTGHNLSKHIAQCAQARNLPNFLWS